MKGLTKGIEEVTLASMVEVLRETTPRRLHASLGTLSGPSFAREVAQGQPTAVVVAAKELAVARAVQAALGTSYLRIYTSGDLAGVEIGGAVKNVMAIAAGMSRPKASRITADLFVRQYSRTGT